ncbi:hypothetical protein DXG01_012252 [Tephrocybe rancida]|nr:hypothetical protein DXG01_012252 [Tephrocybe rancida]
MEIISRCLDFVNTKFLSLQAQINETIRQSNTWTRFLDSAEIANAIARYKQQIDDMRSNFTLELLVRIHTKLLEHTPPRHLDYTVNLVHFIDAMNDRIPVPMDQCLSPKEFNNYINLRFRQRLGYEMERGDYDLSVLQVMGAQQSLGRGSETWALLVEPGATIVMDVLLRSHSENLDTDSRQCPSCGHLCRSASLGDEVICPQCSTTFCVSRAMIEEIERDAADSTDITMDAPSGMQRQHEKALPSLHTVPNGSRIAGRRQFRRFRVLLHELERHLPPAKVEVDCVTPMQTFSQEDNPSSDMSNRSHLIVDHESSHAGAANPESIANIDATPDTEEWTPVVVDSLPLVAIPSESVGGERLAVATDLTKGRAREAAAKQVVETYGMLF